MNRLSASLFVVAWGFLGCTPNNGSSSSSSSGGSADAGVNLDAGSRPDAAVAPDAGTSGGADAGVVLPSTHAGTQLAAFLDVINTSTGDCSFTQTLYASMFSASYRAATTLSSFNQNVARPLCALAPLVVTGWENTATDTMIWARVHSPMASKWLRLAMDLETTDPFLITKLYVLWAYDLDPAVGPRGPTQLDVHPYDPSTGRYLPGATVEAVDRTTGQSFNPAVTAVADSEFTLARLTLPAGVAEVGLRMTHTDTTVSYVYSSNLKPGKAVNAPAYPFTAFPYYANLVDVTLTSGKAHVWGITLFHDNSARQYTFDVVEEAVGCATASFSPAATSTFYTAPPNYLPTTTATQTAPNWATFYSFNLDPVAHTVTAQATGEPLAVPLPPLVPDVATSVYMVYQAPAYSTNPMASGCSP